MADHPAPSRPKPRYAPTTGSGIRAVRFGLSELTQRGRSVNSLRLHQRLLQAVRAPFVSLHSTGESAGRTPAQFFYHPVTHDELLWFAGDRHRQFIHDANMAWHFEMGDLAIAEYAQGLP